MHNIEGILLTTVTEEMKSKEDELAALLQGQDTPKQTAGKKSWFRFWSTN